ncbi:MAG: (deoxy)nucleoside triphosphate pyrophosphohydrolase [Pseudobdellovibrio sp.]
MSSNAIEVVALALQRKSDLRFLIARRGPGQIGSGHWEFPGGKVEKNEDQKSALGREILEELNFKLDLGKLIFVSDHYYQYPGRLIHLFLWRLAVEQTPDFTLTDHDQIAWSLPEEMSQYPLSPADIYFIDKLL